MSARVARFQTRPNTNLLPNPLPDSTWIVSGYGTGGAGNLTTTDGVARQTWTTRPTASGGNISCGTRAPVQAGVSYTFSVMARWSQAAVTAQIRLLWLDAGGAQVSITTLAVTPVAGEWGLRTVTATAPANAAFLLPSVRTNDFTLESGITVPYYQEAKNAVLRVT
jgi:hypothetical protein